MMRYVLWKLANDYHGLGEISRVGSIWRVNGQ